MHERLRILRAVTTPLRFKPTTLAWYLLQLMVAATTLGPAIASATTAIRVNVGGPAYVDSASNTWQADTGYNTGNVATTASSIAGTSDPVLFKTQRWDPVSGPELEYSFTVPNGVYEVRLSFAESYTGAFAVGARVFSVQLEGATVWSNLDIFAEVGANTALIKSSVLGVTDGQLNIRFLHGPIENPTVHAIEILSTGTPSAPTGLAASPQSPTQINLNWNSAIDDVAVANYVLERCIGSGCSAFAPVAAPAATTYSDSGLTPATTYQYRVRATDADGHFSAYSNVLTVATSSATQFTPIRVNAGGASYTDAAGKVWAADVGYSGGSAFSWSHEISGTPDQPLYMTGRYDPQGSTEMSYSFAVPTGSYEVKLHFAEGWPPYYAVGLRVFNVKLEGATVLPNFDVFAEAGASTAMVKTLPVNVVDGQLNIDFVHGPADNPFVNAVEVSVGTLSDAVPPAAPSSLIAIAASATQIDLNWSASTDNVGVTAYEIERCQGVGCSVFTPIGVSSTPTYQDSSVASGAYRYRVRARDAANNRSLYSNIATASTLTFGDTVAPSAPTNVTATAVSSTQVDVRWNAATDNVGVSDYLIERCQGFPCTTFTQVATRTGTVFRDTGRSPVTSYTYRVRARDVATNLSSYSNTDSATTPINGADCD